MSNEVILFAWASPTAIAIALAGLLAGAGLAWSFRAARISPATTPKPGWIALFWLGVLMVAVAWALFFGGIGPLLDGADEPIHGAIGQALVLASPFILVGGLAAIAIAVAIG